MAGQVKSRDNNVLRVWAAAAVVEVVELQKSKNQHNRVIGWLTRVECGVTITTSSADCSDFTFVMLRNPVLFFIAFVVVAAVCAGASMPYLRFWVSTICNFRQLVFLVLVG